MVKMLQNRVEGEGNMNFVLCSLLMKHIYVYIYIYKELNASEYLAHFMPVVSFNTS